MSLPDKAVSQILAQLESPAQLMPDMERSRIASEGQNPKEPYADAPPTQPSVTEPQPTKTKGFLDFIPESK